MERRALFFEFLVPRRTVLRDMEEVEKRYANLINGGDLVI